MPWTWFVVTQTYTHTHTHTHTHTQRKRGSENALDVHVCVLEGGGGSERVLDAVFGVKKLNLAFGPFTLCPMPCSLSLSLSRTRARARSLSLISLSRALPPSLLLRMLRA